MTTPDAMLPPRAEMVRAMLACDSAYEGVFYTAVRTTGIFCRPTCTARKPKPENVEFYRTAVDAVAAGFRPCKRCNPLDAAAVAPGWVRPLIEAANTGPAIRITDEDILACGIDPVRLRRWFKKNFGMTFHTYVRTRRLASALGRLNIGDSIDDAALDHGYESLSGFRAGFRKRFGISPGRGRTAEALLFTRLNTPLGPMVAMAEKRGIVLLEFLDRPALTREIETLRSRYGYAVAPGTNSHLEQLESELQLYFAGESTRFTVPLHTPGNPFEVAVWNYLRQIPFGTTRNYGEIAVELGKPGSSRAVGLANGRNRIAIAVPCHRVIGADGALTGYGGGMPRKAFLLRLERDVLATRAPSNSEALPFASRGASR